jgi:hypothetical protein
MRLDLMTIVIKGWRKIYGVTAIRKFILKEAKVLHGPQRQ